jgi:tryptophanyl-tRNA synthetase
LLGDRAKLGRILARGAERAREAAAATVTQVYDRVGFLAPAALSCDAGRR